MGEALQRGQIMYASVHSREEGLYMIILLQTFGTILIFSENQFLIHGVYLQSILQWYNNQDEFPKQNEG